MIKFNSQKVLNHLMSSHQLFSPLMMLMVVPRRPTSGKRARDAHAHCSRLKEEEAEAESSTTTDFNSSVTPSSNSTLHNLPKNSV